MISPIMSGDVGDFSLIMPPFLLSVLLISNYSLNQPFTNQLQTINTCITDYYTYLARFNK